MDWIFSTFKYGEFSECSTKYHMSEEEKKNTQIFIGSVFVPKTTAQGYILEFTSAKYEKSWNCFTCHLLNL